jgi:FtsP/CotA-like multicopper oxidase with cupredoxin domain
MLYILSITLNCAGDITTVNGKPFPFHRVERRTYRLRMLNASASRAYSIKMLAETADGTQQVHDV